MAKIPTELKTSVLLVQTAKIDYIFMQKLRRWSGRLAENDADEENENA